MSDEKEPVVVNSSQIGGAADGISKGLTRIGKLEQSQILSLIACVGMLVMGGLLSYGSWADREDKKEERRDKQEADATKMREYNAQLELSRQNCAIECEKNRRESREQLKMMLDHHSAESERNTTRIITAIREKNVNGP